MANMAFDPYSKTPDLAGGIQGGIQGLLQALMMKSLMGQKNPGMQGEVGAPALPGGAPYRPCFLMLSGRMSVHTALI